jgi:hypothetical protein
MRYACLAPPRTEVFLSRLLRTPTTIFARSIDRAHQSARWRRRSVLTRLSGRRSLPRDGSKTGAGCCEKYSQDHLGSRQKDDRIGSKGRHRSMACSWREGPMLQPLVYRYGDSNPGPVAEKRSRRCRRSPVALVSFVKSLESGGGRLTETALFVRKVSRFFQGLRA